MKHSWRLCRLRPIETQSTQFIMYIQSDWKDRDGKHIPIKIHETENLFSSPETVKEELFKELFVKKKKVLYCQVIFMSSHPEHKQ